VEHVVDDGGEPAYIKEEVLPSLFQTFLDHRMALDRRNYSNWYTTVEIADK